MTTDKAETMTRSETLPEGSLVLEAVQARRGLFWSIALGVMVLGVAWMVIRPAEWEAHTTIVLPVRPSGIIPSASASQAATSLPGLTGPNPLRQYEFVLESDWTLSYVQNRTHLDRKLLNRSRKIETNPAANTLTLRVKDRDKATARKEAKLYIEGLRKAVADTTDPGNDADLAVLKSSISRQQRLVNRTQDAVARFQRNVRAGPRFMTSGSGDDAMLLVLPGTYLEEEKEAELDLKEIESKIANIRERTEQASKDSVTIPTLIPGVRTMRDDLVGMQVQLETSKALKGPQDPSVLILERKISDQRAGMKREVKAYLKAFNANLVDPALADLLVDKVAREARIKALSELANIAPAEAERYQTLIQDLAVQTAALNKMRAQLSVAQVQAKIDPNHWSVLDDAVLDPDPVNKNLPLTLAEFFSLGLVFATCVAVFLHLRRPLRA